MKKSLSREHRRILENTVAAARIDAEAGAEKALQALAVGAAALPTHLSPEQRSLRVRLREHARQLGDPRGADKAQATDRLLVEVAYEHWHRMLFARFLAESELLMHPDGYPVTLDDCKEDAGALVPPVGSRTLSEWEVAGRYASAMLPNVFRTDSPALALELPLESQQALERHLASLPAEVFEADDSLGWSYQFWQAPRKEAVQRQMKNAGTKVGADELPAVTQLFTEPYMVAFLLENALGAWWHRAHPDKPLPVAMPYLRKLPDGAPAAGTFAGWPDKLSDFKLLDPCLGSGHFLVAALHYLVPMRMGAEGLSAKAAVDGVLAENLHGLELDPRCVEIAAFALALAAWRSPGANGKPLGHRQLPRLNIACCGVAPQGRRADWLKLAGGAEQLEEGMAALYELFQKAPELGSLLDPGVVARGGLFDARADELTGLLDAALEGAGGDSEAAAQTRESAIAAQGMAASVRLLNQRYHLVVTNPPYLKLVDHGATMREFCLENFRDASGDIANVFLERSLNLVAAGGVVQFVMPQNWLFLIEYLAQRRARLRSSTWNLIGWLGEKGFDSPDAAGAFTVLLTITKSSPSARDSIPILDARTPRIPAEKAAILERGDFILVNQLEQLDNPDSIIATKALERGQHLSSFATVNYGSKPGQTERVTRLFWEVPLSSQHWQLSESTPTGESEFTGKQRVFLSLQQIADQGITEFGLRSADVFGKSGILVSQMRDMPASVYLGRIFDNNTSAIIPLDERNLPAIYSFVRSGRYLSAIRDLNTKTDVAAHTMIKVPFNLTYWEKVAAKELPAGIPDPYSDDPTQWIFHGHPQRATDPLQTALVRLLGYRWPAERDASLELRAEARALIARCTELDPLCDDDGIVCLPAVRGEAVAVDRLRAILARAFGADWSAAREAALLREAGCEGLPLAQWLRDKFFAQHVARFQKRPFIWHIWDGHKEGFSALVNVHTFTRAKLQTLIHTYLGDWITQQKRAVDAGDGDATLRLARAQALNDKLEAILEGEAPYDIFVRWKPEHLQPIGWEPDLNDGVRMNIRPFVQAEVLRIPGRQLGIKWEPDRGKDVPSAPWFKLGPKYGEPEGTRINDHHLSLADKQAARAKVSGGKKS